MPPVDNGLGDWTKFDELPAIIMSDARPGPKPRKYPRLWQSYLWWNEFVELRKRHILRISSIERGKSTLDAILEKNILDHIGIDSILRGLKKDMVNNGEEVPVWNWVTNIKGMKQGGLSAQLLAQIDDISKFDTVASLWRFAGFAVIDGKAEKNRRGEKSHYNHKLKGICFNIADQFIKQQTPGYVEIYYAEKERQRALYPDVCCKQCSNGTLVKWESCQNKKSHVKMMSDAHLHTRAWRKMIKAFLRDLWIEWNNRAG